MISRSHRFHGLNSLSHVYRSGKQIRTGNLSFRYLFNPKRRSYRVAVVVSKKVSKSAVVRNRIRRRIFESVRQNEANITKPLDIIISVYDESLQDLPSQKLQEIIATSLKKMNDEPA